MSEARTKTLLNVRRTSSSTKSTSGYWGPPISKEKKAEKDAEADRILAKADEEDEILDEADIIIAGFGK